MFDILELKREIKEIKTNKNETQEKPKTNKQIQTTTTTRKGNQTKQQKNTFSLNSTRSKIKTSCKKF